MMVAPELSLYFGDHRVQPGGAIEADETAMPPDVCVTGDEASLGRWRHVALEVDDPDVTRRMGGTPAQRYPYVHWLLTDLNLALGPAGARGRCLEVADAQRQVPWHPMAPPAGTSHLYRARVFDRPPASATPRDARAMRTGWLPYPLGTQAQLLAQTHYYSGERGRSPRANSLLNPSRRLLSDRY